MSLSRALLVLRATALPACVMVASVAVGHAHAGSVDLPVQSGGPFRVPVQSLKERRFVATVRQQYDFSCGSAALSTLLTHHYGEPVSEGAVFAEMSAQGDAVKIQREGFSLLDMKRYLVAHGFEADGFEASMAELAQAGLPAIALINEHGYHHFVVVKGIRDDRVLIGDPALGTRAMSLQRFEAARANTILFVIGNHKELARFNLEPDWAVAPGSPMAARLDSGATASVTLPRSGAGGI